MTVDDFDDEEDSFGEDRPGGLDEDPGGCVLGEDCCCPHPYHGADECFSSEWAERYFAETGEQPSCCDRHEAKR